MTMITIFTYPVGGAGHAADRLSWVPVSTAAIDDLAVVDWPADDDRPSAWQATPVVDARHHLSGAFWGLLFGHLFLLPITHGPRHRHPNAATPGAVRDPLAHLGLGAGPLTAIRDAVVPGSSALFVLHADDQAENVTAAIGRRRRPAVTIALSPTESSLLTIGFGEPSTAAAG